MILDDFPAWFLRTFAIAFGLAWGSFLNVVIYRLPRGMSVVRPPSHCPACGTPIRAWDNVPLFGYLLLRGRARCCKAKMSPRYPLVEAIGGLLAFAVVETIVLRMPPQTSMALAGAVFVADLALALGLVAAAFIDLEHMILPDSITYGGAALGLATCSFRGLSFVDSIVGAAVGFVFVWLPFIVGYGKLSGRPGMGLGDAKLMALAGAWFGWPGALFVLGAGAVQGTVATLAIVALRGRIEEPEAVRQEREEVRAELAAMSPEERAAAEAELRDDPLMEEAGEGLGKARIPFGPFLVLAILECLFIGPEYFMNRIGTLVGWLTEL